MNKVIPKKGVNLSQLLKDANQTFCTYCGCDYNEGCLNSSDLAEHMEYCFWKKHYKTKPLNTQVVFPMHGAGGIFFPTGVPVRGGTCEFATEKCAKNCIAKIYKVTDTERLASWKAFLNATPEEFVVTIIRDLEKLQKPILHWFASGDCTMMAMPKIIKIMRLLVYHGVRQNGFTRNIALFEEMVNYYTPIALCLTVESKNKKWKSVGKHRGMYAYPNWRNKSVDIYSVEGVRKIKFTKAEHEELKRWEGGCGGPSGTVESEKTVWTKHKTVKMNCVYCYLKGIMCFKKVMENDWNIRFNECDYWTRQKIKEWGSQQATEMTRENCGSRKKCQQSSDYCKSYKD